MPIKNKKWKNIILLLLGFASLVMLFEIFPRILNTYSLVNEWIEQSDQIEKLGKVEARINDITEQNGKVKVNISSLVSDYEDNQKISSVLSLIDEIAKNTDVYVESIKPGNIIKKDNLWLQPINIIITAKYENFYNFIRFLEGSPKVVIVKEIMLKDGDSTKGKLNVNTKLEVYLNL